MGNKQGAMEAPVRRSVVEAICRAFASRDRTPIGPFIDDEAKWTIQRATGCSISYR
jgi:hypothetical protein